MENVHTAVTLDLKIHFKRTHDQALAAIKLMVEKKAFEPDDALPTRSFTIIKPSPGPMMTKMANLGFVQRLAGGNRAFMVDESVCIGKRFLWTNEQIVLARTAAVKNLEHHVLVDPAVSEAVKKFFNVEDPKEGLKKVLPATNNDEEKKRLKKYNDTVNFLMENGFDCAKFKYGKMEWRQTSNRFFINPEFAERVMAATNNAK